MAKDLALARRERREVLVDFGQLGGRPAPRRVILLAGTMDSDEQVVQEPQQYHLHDRDQIFSIGSFAAVKFRGLPAHEIRIEYLVNSS